MLLLYLRQDRLDRLLLVLVALAAGSLLGGAFFHLLPRTIEAVSAGEEPFLAAIGGFCTFYALERFVDLHHHHATIHAREPVTYLVLVFDTVHNFLDGLVIASAFLVSVPLGLVTTLAVALHAVPQEIGDFGVLDYGGFDRRRAFALNYLTQAAVIVGGLVGVALGDAVGGAPPLLSAFAAGSFVYIASADLVPELGTDGVGRSLVHFGAFLLGLGPMYGVRLLHEGRG